MPDIDVEVFDRCPLTGYGRVVQHAVESSPACADLFGEPRSAAYNPGSMKAYETAKRIYAASGAPDALRYHVTPGVKHEFDIEPVHSFLAETLPLD